MQECAEKINNMKIIMSVRVWVSNFMVYSIDNVRDVKIYDRVSTHDYALQI